MTRAATLLVLFSLLSCKRSEDQAAKQRIFSPEEPIGALAEAKEPLDAGRLGAHKAQTRVQFAWFRGPGASDGGTDVSLAEDSSLHQAGSGDFSVRQENDRNQGFELVWVKGQVFVRGLFGPFRKRRTDRSDPERVRELAMGALPTFDRLAHGLRLQRSGEATVEGRRAIRYQVTGSAGRPPPAERTDLPKLEYPVQPWQKEEPTRVAGTVVVDAQTGVALAADLQGHFRVPGEGGPAAELDLHSVLAVSAIGKDPGVQPPQFEPEPSVPHAVKDPLRYLGKAPAPGAEEPATEDSDEEASEQPAEQPARQR